MFIQMKTMVKLSVKKHKERKRKKKKFTSITSPVGNLIGRTMSD